VFALNVMKKGRVAGAYMARRPRMILEVRQELL
jgi:hypothetical protein